MKNRQEELATIKEVAKLAGVSSATVSRVFDPKWEDKVSESTRDKVLSAAKKLSLSKKSSYAGLFRFYGVK